MEKLVELLNGPNAPMYVMLAVVVLFVAIMLSKRGVLGIHTKYVTLGATSREDTIKDNQLENAYLFIMGLEATITVDMQNNPEYNKYKTRWILERIYDEVVTWIMHNHIREDEAYVKQKSEKLRSLTYMLGVNDVFKSEDFAYQMDSWTKELIGRLVRVRRVYEQGGGLL